MVDLLSVVVVDLADARAGDLFAEVDVDLALAVDRVVLQNIVVEANPEIVGTVVVVLLGGIANLDSSHLQRTEEVGSG